MSGSSNFLQWDPSQANMETDSQYETDSSRSGGAATDTPFTSPLANKAFYQWSTFIWAFGQMLAAAGANVSDSSSTALITTLGQYIALLASPSFTGTPTAPTPSTSDDSTKIATTAFVNALLTAGFTISLASPGYIKCPSWMGGLIIQWGGFETASGNNDTVSLPIAFPNTCFSITVSEGAAHGGWNTTNGPTIYGTQGAGGGSISSFGISCMRLNSGGANWAFTAGAFCTWIAIGH